MLLRHREFDFEQYGYQLVSYCGGGNYGKAYLVRSLDTGELRIAKTVDLTELLPATRQSALQEANLLLKLQHPHVVTCYEAFIHQDNYLVMIMEYCRGGDMSCCLNNMRITGERFPEKEIVRMFRQLLTALAFIHEHSVLHRDLKPSNILIDQRGNLKIADFGVARILTGDTNAQTSTGTPNYMPPEMCKKRPYTYHSDMWSLGCVLYEITTLRAAFEGDSIIALAWNVCFENPPALDDKSRYSQALERILHSLLSKEPEQRVLPGQLLVSDYFSGQQLCPESTLFDEDDPDEYSALDEQACGRKLWGSWGFEQGGRIRGALPQVSNSPSLSSSSVNQASSTTTANNNNQINNTVATTTTTSSSSATTTTIINDANTGATNISSNKNNCSAPVLITTITKTSQTDNWSKNDSRSKSPTGENTPVCNKPNGWGSDDLRQTLTSGLYSDNASIGSTLHIGLTITRIMLSAKRYALLPICMIMASLPTWDTWRSSLSVRDLTSIGMEESRARFVVNFARDEKSIPVSGSATRNLLNFFRTPINYLDVMEAVTTYKMGLSRVEVRLLLDFISHTLKRDCNPIDLEWALANAGNLVHVEDDVEELYLWASNVILDPYGGTQAYPGLAKAVEEFAQSCDEGLVMSRNQFLNIMEVNLSRHLPSKEAAAGLYLLAAKTIDGDILWTSTLRDLDAYRRMKVGGGSNTVGKPMNSHRRDCEEDSLSGGACSSASPAARSDRSSSAAGKSPRHSPEKRFGTYDELDGSKSPLGASGRRYLTLIKEETSFSGHGGNMSSDVPSTTPTSLSMYSFVREELLDGDDFTRPSLSHRACSTRTIDERDLIYNAEEMKLRRRSAAESRLEMVQARGRTLRAVTNEELRHISTSSGTSFRPSSSLLIMFDAPEDINAGSPSRREVDDNKAILPTPHPHHPFVQSLVCGLLYAIHVGECVFKVLLDQLRDLVASQAERPETSLQLISKICQGGERRLSILTSKYSTVSQHCRQERCLNEAFQLFAARVTALKVIIGEFPRLVYNNALNISLVTYLDPMISITSSMQAIVKDFLSLTYNSVAVVQVMQLLIKRLEILEQQHAVIAKGTRVSRAFYLTFVFDLVTNATLVLDHCKSYLKDSIAPPDGGNDFGDYHDDEERVFQSDDHSDKTGNHSGSSHDRRSSPPVSPSSADDRKSTNNKYQQQILQNKNRLASHKSQQQLPQSFASRQPQTQCRINNRRSRPSINFENTRCRKDSSMYIDNFTRIKPRRRSSLPQQDSTSPGNYIPMRRAFVREDSIDSDFAPLPSTCADSVSHSYCKPHNTSNIDRWGQHAKVPRNPMRSDFAY